jgi:hypothetical protein
VREYIPSWYDAFPLPDDFKLPADFLPRGSREELISWYNELRDYDPLSDDGLTLDRRLDAKYNIMTMLMHALNEANIMPEDLEPEKSAGYVMAHLHQLERDFDVAMSRQYLSRLMQTHYDTLPEWHAYDDLSNISYRLMYAKAGFRALDPAGEKSSAAMLRFAVEEASRASRHTYFVTDTLPKP